MTEDINGREEIPFDQEMTIPAAFGKAGVVEDYGKLREEFSIFPSEDGSGYQNMQLLGIGGMGVVYSADDPTLQRCVAVKMLREPFRDDREQIGKFVNEARITAKIDHPNIVAVHQLGVNETHGVYFSMRRISGETLQTAIRKLNGGDEAARHHYTQRRMLDIFIAGCNGVAAAHGKGVMHCDLKPANIMVGDFGEVLVLDWGLARMADAESDAEKTEVVQKNADAEKSIAGTPAFMAPELLCGEIAIPDEKTEVYALGCILYCILTWRLTPFVPDMDHDELIYAAAHGKYLPLQSPHGGRRINAELSAICKKAMAKDRRCRYGSVKDLLADLNNYRDGYAVKAYSPTVLYRFFKYCRRRPVIPMAVCVAVLTLVIYHALIGFSEMSNDRALLHLSKVNFDIAGGYYRHTVAQYSENIRPDENISPLDLAMNENNMLSQVHLAMIEYFSILDSAAGFSDTGRRDFVSMYGADIFRRVLELQIISGDREQLDATLKRCRRYSFFETACSNDIMLDALVRRIDDRVGVLQITVPENLPEKMVVQLYLPDGSVRHEEISDGFAEWKLPEGTTQAFFDNGQRMRFYMIPGSREAVYMPETESFSGAVFIPRDHFFISLPQVEKARCDVLPFYIRTAPISGMFDMESANAFLNREENIQWRLPYMHELLKAWSGSSNDPDNPQQSFYMVDKCTEPVLLITGEFFDPLSGNVVNSVEGNVGRIYLVREVQGGDQW